MSEQQQIVMHAWRLDTSAFTCMAPSCRLLAQVALNVWVQEREWLVLFLCTACAFRAKNDTALLQGFLGEKRVRESEAREFDVICRKRKRAA